MRIDGGNLGVAADVEAVQRLLACDPAWVDVRRLDDVVDLPVRTVLHAGPRFLSWKDTPRPVQNSATLAAVYEGWASDPGAAGRLFASQELRLAPAQDYDVVVPLAGVASRSMAVNVVVDLERPEVRTYSPLNEGPEPALRVGVLDQAVLEKQRWLNQVVGPEMQVALARQAEPLRLWPLADSALIRGDDCHSRSSEGTALVREALQRSDVRMSTVERFFEATESAAMNLWMAAAATALGAATGIRGSSLVTAAAGNGVSFGIQLSGDQEEWHCTIADPPKTDQKLPARALPAIGDSATIDCFGLGAMARSSRSAGADRRVLCSPHPAFARSGCWVGLTARQIIEYRSTPTIALGALDASGARGRLGGGVYTPPLEVFRSALKAVGDRGR